MCGAPLNVENNDKIIECEYCFSKQTLPRLDDDRRANLYDRANHFRRNNEFDKAVSIYEQILNEDKNDAEAYWSLVLCTYGVTYVEDPETHNRVPTVNRAQYTSIFDDENYKSALALADFSQKPILESEAEEINTIQKGIVAISEKEAPFDVFICYKETDENGRRTRDSVIATELYHELTKEGLKVFFARITLEDKLGAEYEPYIFAALHSAKVMVVIGTKSEYFNAVWVKNEWSRFLSLIKSGKKKVLIPAYRDMDPYDLPKEFSHLQAQDMNKLGFVQDLIRGIKKITNVGENSDNKTAKVVDADNIVKTTNMTQVQSLIKRGFMFLEDINAELRKNRIEEWNLDIDWNVPTLEKALQLFQTADSYFEKALDIMPESSQAYLGKFLVEKRITSTKFLSKLYYNDIEDNQFFEKTVNFANAKEKDVFNRLILKIKDNTYNESVSKIQNSNDICEILHEMQLLKTIAPYKDIDAQIELAKQKKDSLLIASMKNLLYGNHKFNEDYDYAMKRAVAFASESGTNNEEIKKLAEEIEKKQVKIALLKAKVNDVETMRTRLINEEDDYSWYKKIKYTASKFLFTISFVLIILGVILITLVNRGVGIALIVFGVLSFVGACVKAFFTSEKKSDRENSFNRSIDITNHDLRRKKYKERFSFTDDDEAIFKNHILGLAEKNKNLKSINEIEKRIENYYNNIVIRFAIAKIKAIAKLGSSNLSRNKLIFANEMTKPEFSANPKYKNCYKEYSEILKNTAKVKPYKIDSLDVSNALIVYEIFFDDWLLKLEKEKSLAHIENLKKTINSLDAEIEKSKIALKGDVSKDDEKISDIPYDTQIIGFLVEGLNLKLPLTKKNLAFLRDELNNNIESYEIQIMELEEKDGDVFTNMARNHIEYMLKNSDNKDLDSLNEGLQTLFKN